MSRISLSYSALTAKFHILHRLSTSRVLHSTDDELRQENQSAAILLITGKQFTRHRKCFTGWTGGAFESESHPKSVTVRWFRATANYLVTPRITTNLKCVCFKFPMLNENGLRDRYMYLICSSAPVSYSLHRPSVMSHPFWEKK